MKKHSKTTEKIHRGGIRAPEPVPAKESQETFHKTAKKKHPANFFAPMRGGIRF